MSFLKYRAHPGERTDKPIPDATNATKNPSRKKGPDFSVLGSVNQKNNPINKNQNLFFFFSNLAAYA